MTIIQQLFAGSSFSDTGFAIFPQNATKSVFKQYVRKAWIIFYYYLILNRLNNICNIYR